MDKANISEIFPAPPSDADMELINRFSRKALTADEVYTFSVVLCDNEIDRDLERFSADALKSLAGMFVGKTGIFDHNMKSGSQTARLFKAELLTDPKKKTSAGEPYAYVKAMAYMPKTEKNADLIVEIDAGIKKEVSIGCAVRKVTCSECGADQKKGSCEHVRGKAYGGRLCHSILSDPADAYEWSFVAVPAQPLAGVVKSFNKEEKRMNEVLKSIKSEHGGNVTLKTGELAVLKKAIAALEKQAADGTAYKNALIGDTVRFGLISLPAMDGGRLKSICERLSTEELEELKKAFSHSAQKHVPLNLQLVKPDSQAANQNDEFKI
ncbi:MAG: hypothetical protein FWF05_09495 [Oscillospiraceae bacterium]|nr:hypothetical protein [Oscillospiraceae bacterium]